jgi:hypothetical protein
MDLKHTEEYKTNIFKPTYDVDNLDKELIKQAQWHEEKAFQCRKEAGLIAHVYVLATHSVVLKKLAQKGRLLQFTQYETTGKNTTRKYGWIDGIRNLTIEQFEEEVNVYNIPTYHKQPYARIDVVIVKEETIAMVTGYSEKINNY